MRWFGYLVVAVVSSALTAWMFSGGHFVGPARRLDPPKVEFVYSDFISVSLTMVTVVLGALAIVIGIIAFRTVKEIKLDAAAVATKHSSATIDKHMKAVPTQVNSAVDTIVEGRLPDVIHAEVIREIEIYAKDGRLAEIIERAQLRRSFFNLEAQEELQEGFDNQDGSGESHGES
jgi:hypothetical protein